MLFYKVKKLVARRNNPAYWSAAKIALYLEQNIAKCAEVSETRLAIFESSQKEHIFGDFNGCFGEHHFLRKNGFGYFGQHFNIWSHWFCVKGKTSSSSSPSGPTWRGLTRRTRTATPPSPAVRCTRSSCCWRWRPREPTSATSSSSTTRRWCLTRISRRRHRSNPSW